MSTVVFEKKYALQLPNSFVDIDSDEMEYVEGGLGAPNWLVGGAINTAITALTGGTAGAAAASLRGLAKKYGAQAAKTMFSKQLKKKLMAKGIAAGLASGIASAASGAFSVMSWALDPGGEAAKWIDARDPRPNNGWCDIS